MLAVGVVVDRVRLLLADHDAVAHSAARISPRLANSREASSTNSLSAISQRSSPRLQKYSKPRLLMPGSGTIAALQFPKFWMRPTRTPGV